MHITEDHTNVPRRRRRQHSAEFKAELVAAALQPGASVSALALEHGLDANLLFAWRRAQLRSQARQVEGQPAPALLPVQIVTDPADSGDSATAQPTAPASSPVVLQHAGFDPRACSEPSTGHIELRLGGAHLSLHVRVDEQSITGCYDFRCLGLARSWPPPPGHQGVAQQTGSAGRLSMAPLRKASPRQSLV